MTCWTWCSIRSQIVESQALPLSPKKHSRDPVQGMVINRPFIEPEGVLVNVPTKVLTADVVVDALEPGLEDSPYGFSAVGMHFPATYLPSEWFTVSCS